MAIIEIVEILVGNQVKHTLLNQNGVYATNTELTIAPQFNPQAELKEIKKNKPAAKEPWHKGKLIGQKPPLKLKEA